MSITRTRLQFENHFTQIPNAWLRDKRITRRARGLLAEIMSHEVGWRLTTETLTNGGPEGRDAVRGAIIELEDAGYLTRVTKRDGTKFAGIDYILSDPFEDAELSTGKRPVPENPTLETNSQTAAPTGIPATGKPAPENPTLRTSSKEHHLQNDESALVSTSPAQRPTCFACGTAATGANPVSATRPGTRAYCLDCKSSGNDNPMLNCIAVDEGCTTVGKRSVVGQQYIICTDHRDRATPIFTGNA